MTLKRLLTKAVYGRRYDRVPWPQLVYLRPAERWIRRAQGAWRSRRARPVSLAEYRAATPLGPIEEFVGCPLCGQTRLRPRYRPRAEDGGWEYRVVSCTDCGFLYRNPNIRPEHLGDLYATGYSRFLTGRYARNRQRRYRAVMDAVSPVLDDGHGRRLLDFGCGAGLFLELAEQRGFEAYGVDLSPDSVNQARQRLRSAKVFHGSAPDVAQIAGGGFHVITMWSVLAHLPRPVEDLSMLRGLLVDDGALVIMTVNAESLHLQGLGSRWQGFTRNHLMFYSRATLPRLLARAGFGAVGFAPFYGEELAIGGGLTEKPATGGGLTEKPATGGGLTEKPATGGGLTEKPATGSRLSPAQVDRLKRRVTATDYGSMLVAAGFATGAAADRWGGRLPDLRTL